MFWCPLIQNSIGGFFAHIASPDRWGKTRVEFVIITSPMKSGETVFCHPNQDRVEACDALTVLYQHNSSKPSVVVVSRYFNTSYIPCTLSGHGHFLQGHSFCPLPFRQAAFRPAASIQRIRGAAIK